MAAIEKIRRFGWIAAGVVCGSAALPGPALAGGFGVHEQSTTFLGTAFAGSAAGHDLSSMFWNPAAAAALPGCNSSSSYSLIIGRSEETARSGTLVTGTPLAPGITTPGLSPTSTDVGSDVLVPATYLACQISDKLFAGLALNSPFGLLTKPDNQSWAGSPIAITSKIFTVDINPTLAYKLTPTLTLGVGLQVEYFRIRLTHGDLPSPLGALSGSRTYEPDDWGVGATAGALWEPLPGTSFGIGYRSAVGIDAEGRYRRGAGLTTGPNLVTTATADLTLPDQVTASFRHTVALGWTLLGTVEWTNWSRLSDVAAVGSGCGAGGVCEVLNLDYRDGWLYALGVEHAYSAAVTLRAGVGYETSPIDDRTRDILLPDSNRVFLNLGGSYKYSDNITLDFGYSHVFFDSAPFCIANAAANGGSTHCNSETPAAAVLLRGDIDTSVDIVSAGLRYRF